MTAILAPRFLASAFASGPALLILLCLLLEKLTKFEVGARRFRSSADRHLRPLANLFFVLMEAFTAFYSAIPEDIAHFDYLFVGIDGHNTLVPWMWTSMSLAVVAVGILLIPRYRHNEKTLVLACAMIFVAIWIDKGMGMVVGGFVPTTLGTITDYTPTLPEVLISVGIYAVGFLMITVFFKIALAVREETGALRANHTAAPEPAE